MPDFSHPVWKLGENHSNEGRHSAYPAFQKRDQKDYRGRGKTPHAITFGGTMTTISYENKAATEQQQKNEAAQEARNREVFFEALCRWPLKEHEANYQLLLSWSGDGLLSVEKIEYLLKHKPAGFNFDSTTRELLIGELGEFLRDTTSQKTLSDYDFRQWVLRASTWSLRQLRA